LADAAGKIFPHRDLCPLLQWTPGKTGIKSVATAPQWMEFKAVERRA
jgi:hypothetical protein